MRLFLGRSLLVLLTIGLVAEFSNVLFAQTSAQERIGLVALQEEFGTSLPDGEGVSVALVEAHGIASSNYLPDATSTSLAGVTINNLGEPLRNQTAGVSSHATTSAANLVGTASVSNGVESLNVFSTGYWSGSGGLRYGTSFDPLSHTYDVSNHSYVYGISDDFGTNEAEAFLARLDYYVQQNDSTVVVGSTNGGGLPLGLVPAYNAISVGISGGTHGAGVTSFYGAGRTKVDIVAPATTASRATPIVASAAILLVDGADGNVNAKHTETIRATLLAGATKDGTTSDSVTDWDRTTTRPLDEVYGAGEVNIYNSYKIQQGGEFEGTSILGGAAVGDLGWDYEDSFVPAEGQFYRFEVLSDEYVNELSIALSWNLNVVDGGSGNFNFDPSTNLTNFDLQLYDSVGGLVDASLSTVDNVEHIYAADLTPGLYDLRVSGDNVDQYALAWRFTGTTLPGDFNADQVVDAQDIDFYTGNLGQPADGELAQLDLDEDGMITLADRDLHITTLVPLTNGAYGALIGDLNFDGQVDVSKFEMIDGVLVNTGDASVLLASLGTIDGASYLDGDLNGDGDVDVSEILLVDGQGVNLGDASRLLVNLGKTSEPVVAPGARAVPEPAGGALLMGVWVLSLTRRVRRS